MTEKQLLKALREACVYQPLLSGTIVVIYGVAKCPPLIISDDTCQWNRGQWVLQECIECGVNRWKFTYRYRVPEYYIEARSQGDDWIKMIFGC